MITTCGICGARREANEIHNLVACIDHLKARSVRLAEEVKEIVAENVRLRKQLEAALAKETK